MAKKEAFARIQLKSVELYESTLVRQIQGAATSKFNFNINLENKADHKNKVIQVVCFVKITGEDATNILGTISTGCNFVVENYSDLVKIGEDASVTIEKPLIDTLNLITLSTTRGVMFSQFRGTFLHYAFLPILDMTAFQAIEKATADLHKSSSPRE